MSAPRPTLALQGIARSFMQGGERIEVLRDVSLSLRRGEIVALVGPSGAGKSTLLHIAGLLERPERGEVVLMGTSCGRLSDSRRTEARRRLLGFIYQFHHLMPEFSALENVMLPQILAGLTKSEARARGRQMLAALGLGPRENHRPAKLSGGEQQRVAIARAVANLPAVVLADEPTGNLDHRTADAVFAQLQQVVRSNGLSALIATHNLELAGRMDRVLRLQDGIVAPG